MQRIPDGIFSELPTYLHLLRLGKAALDRQTTSWLHLETIKEIWTLNTLNVWSLAGKGNAEKEVVKDRVFTDSYPIEDEEALNAAKSRGYDKLGNAGIMAKIWTKHQYLAFCHLTASDNLQGLKLFMQEWVFRLKTRPSPASTTGYRETSEVPNAPSSSRKRRPGDDASRYGDPAVPPSKLALVQGQHNGFLFCWMLPAVTVAMRDRLFLLLILTYKLALLSSFCRRCSPSLLSLSCSRRLCNATGVDRARALRRVPPDSDQAHGR
ncbi:unnamed protein product [Cercospora beticola]|nr:unnamed protein product [Cercospora beticola]